MKQLLIRILDSKNPNSIASRFRNGRFRLFSDLFPEVISGQSLKILDVGGTPEFWSAFPTIKKHHTTILNLSTSNSGQPHFTEIIGDACDLSRFRDHEFDIVFSNSVIEHVGKPERQAMMASEMVRVGKSLWLQTPNFWFPIEPHFAFPGFQWLPRSVRARLIQSFDLGQFKRAPRREAALAKVDGVSLLTKGNLRTFFPKHRILEETFLGLAKSFIVTDRRPGGPGLLS